MQLFPQPSDATHKIWSRLANCLQRYSSLKVWTTTDDDGRRRTTDDGRTTDHWYTISSPCEPSAQVSLKKMSFFSSSWYRGLAVGRDCGTPGLFFYYYYHHYSQTFLLVLFCCLCVCVLSKPNLLYHRVTLSFFIFFFLFSFFFFFFFFFFVVVFYHKTTAILWYNNITFFCDFTKPSIDSIYFPFKLNYR